MAEWAADTTQTELPACGIGAPHATTLDGTSASGFECHRFAGRRLGTRPQPSGSDRGERKRNARAKNGQGSRVHLLSAIGQDVHAVLAQVVVGEKSNEIPHFPLLMDHFPSLAEVVATADALHTQTAQAHCLAGRGAH